MKILIAILSVLAAVQASSFDDIVEYLPGMGDFKDFPMYSGYLDIQPNDMNFHSTKHLHYIFVESQKEPSKAPLVVWFNGGPGCSSMLGFLQENGPYVMEDGQSNFHRNEYSWNLNANVLYIESPAGVGFSYCNSTEADDSELCQFDDISSSFDNLQVILKWFSLYSEYK